MTGEQKKFIDRVGEAAIVNMRDKGLLASLVIAQAILESAWGKSGLTVRANALFGIKAGPGWGGRVYSAATKECYDGINFTTITALFRAYDSWADSIADHAALITQAPRYRAVVCETDYRVACRAIHKAGYATDPAYAEKLINLIELYDLHNRFDKVVLDMPGTVKVMINDTLYRVGAENIKNAFYIRIESLGNMLVSLRDVLEISGHTVEWDAATATVRAYK